MIWMRFVGLAHSSFNLFLPPRRRSFRNYALYRLRSGFFFLFNFFILIFSFYLLHAPLCSFRRWQSSRLLNKLYSESVSTSAFITVSLDVRPFSKFYKTVQRAPMAHRQWSQEQYKFKFFKFRLLANLPLDFIALVGTDYPVFLNEVFPALVFRSSLVSFYRLLLIRSFGFHVSFC
uniref:ribosomal protein S10 n=1 Tax=Euplotes vannus TaxID=5939 RepID=UPI002E770CF2|nr:ribosomal protein S10 [Euplotes vannus]UPM52100.1 ribosomal protein S10 [Euplotes vannus]